MLDVLYLALTLTHEHFSLPAHIQGTYVPQGFIHIGILVHLATTSFANRDCRSEDCCRLRFLQARSRKLAYQIGEWL